MKLKGLTVGMLTIMSLQNACEDDAQPWNTDPKSTTGSGGGGGGEAVNNHGEQMFRALQNEIVSACGSCHTTGTDTPFLGSPEDDNPDPYVSITSWPRFVVKDAVTSKLLTWPNSAEHAGSKTDAPLEAKIQAWLEEEAKGVADVSKETKPTTTPFKPVMGFNAIYLDSIDAKFKGMAITFTADELTPKSLSIVDLTVHPKNDLGLALKHPLFSFYAQGSDVVDPDPIDSFSNVEENYEAGESGSLGPGTVILTNWRSGGKLSIAFDVLETIEPFDPGAGGGGTGPGSGCVAPQEFMDNAVGPLQANCTGCHGGNNTTATNAVDMSALGDDPETTCGQLRNRVNFGNPAQSQLFITTNPNGNATHPYKFNGNGGTFNNFVNALTAWIEQEGA